MANDQTQTRNDEPSWDRVMTELKRLVERDYKTCEYASVVVHVAEGVPDLVMPVIPPGPPPHSPTC